MADQLPDAAGGLSDGLGPSFWLAAAWLALVALAAGCAGILPLAPPDQIDWGHLAAKPGVGGHLLGSDGTGRDIASRLVFGARVTLTIGVAAPCIGLLVGAAMGVIAGFYRGLADWVLSATVDVMLAFPRLIFLFMIVAVFGGALLNLTLAMGLVCIPFFARMARAHTIKLVERDFIRAARATGASGHAIMLREILPNLQVPMVVFLLQAMGLVMTAEIALGFLGLSVPPPAPTWGGMIGEGRELLDQAPHVSMIPSAAMFFTILSINLIGDRLLRRSDTREGQL